MAVRFAAALGGKARRFVEHNGAGSLFDNHGVRLFDVFWCQLALWFRSALGIFTARRNAQDLPLGKAVIGLRPLAINANLARARPARHCGKADLRQIALEPTVEPDAIVILDNGKLAHVLRSRARGVSLRLSRFVVIHIAAHDAIRMIISPR